MQDIFFAVYCQNGVQGTETAFPIVEITTTDGSVHALQYERVPTMKNKPDGGSFSPNFYIDEYYAGGEEITLNDPTAPFICHVYSGDAPHKIQLEIRENGHEETRTFVLPGNPKTIESVRLMTESGFDGTLEELTREEWDAFDFAAVTQPVTEAATTAAETIAATFQTSHTTTAATQHTEPPKPVSNLSAFLPWMIASGVLLAGAIAAAVYFLRTPRQKNPPVPPPVPEPEQTETQVYTRKATRQQSPLTGSDNAEELSPEQAENKRKETRIDRFSNSEKPVAPLRPKTPKELEKEQTDREADELVQQLENNPARKRNSFSSANLGDISSRAERRNVSGGIGRGQNDSGGLVELPTPKRDTSPAPAQRNDPPKQSMPSEKSASKIPDDDGGIMAMDLPPVRPAPKPGAQPKSAAHPVPKSETQPRQNSADGYAYYDFSLFKEELVQSFGSPRGSVFRMQGNRLEPNPLLNEKVRNNKILKYRNIAEKFFVISSSGTPRPAVVDPADVNRIIQKGTLVLSVE